VRITVSVGNGGRPLPWPAAVAFTVVGIAMVVYGISLGPIVVPGEGTGVFPVWVAVLIVVLLWAVYVVTAVKSSRARREVVGATSVPRTLDEPPAAVDPATVAVLVGRGRVPAVAVAATTLGLVERGAIDIHEVGGGVVVSFDPSPRIGGIGLAPTDSIVLHALAARRDAVTGDVQGPPLWEDAESWWTSYARAARAQAIASGWLELRLPLVGLMIVSIVTATVIGLAIFWYTLAFIGTILLANGIPHLLARAGGYRLSAEGRVRRAEWLAFGRGLRERGGLAQAGPGAVSVWGPYLVYGVLVGAGPRAARALTPAVGRHTELPPDVVVIDL